MTTQEMVRVLIDKGHRRDWAEKEAEKDHPFLGIHESAPFPQIYYEECSICRRRFTQLHMKYHNHPCE